MANRKNKSQIGTNAIFKIVFIDIVFGFCKTTFYYSISIMNFNSLDILLNATAYNRLIIIFFIAPVSTSFNSISAVLFVNLLSDVTISQKSKDW